MTNPMSEGFVAHTEKMIADLRAELGPYEAGTAKAGKRLYGGEWEDITPFMIAQIKREVASLENSLARHQEAHA
jgi:hypothetical protein